MTAIRVSAPGKIVLSGEYAVLYGAPAICAAINKRATVALSEIDGDLNRVVAPGYSGVEGQFRSTGNSLEWKQGSVEYDVINSVWRHANTESLRSMHIVLDSREFMDSATGQKIGIGSSSAVVVALAAALERNIEISSIAGQAHADLQSGTGSGVDIACSVNGGVIEYRREGAGARKLDWPSGLLYRVLWTGVAANTADKLKVLKRVANSGKQATSSRARLEAAAEKMAEAWRGSTSGGSTSRESAAESVLTEYQDYIEALRAFSADHKLGIFDAGHDELVDAAQAADLIYKPCGAGGGDVGIVFGKDAEQLRAFTKEQAAKYTWLDCEIDFRGVFVEVSGSQ